MSRKINKDLAVWRSKHFGELEDTLAVAKLIRDDPEASNRDRIEAAKLISRLLHGLQPEKVETKARALASSAPAAKVPALSPEQRARLDQILGHAN